MNCLAVSGSFASRSVALKRQDGQIFEAVAPANEKFSDHIVLLTEQVLHQACLDVSQVSHVVCEIGPGGFTGIRVVVAFVKALMFGVSAKGIGVSSLALLAVLRSESDKPLRVQIKSQGGKWFVQFFAAQNHQPSTQILLLTEAEIAGWEQRLFPGQRTEVLSDQLHYVPKSQDLFRFLAHSKNTDWLQDWKLLNPLYVRPSSAEEVLQLKKHSE